MGKREETPLYATLFYGTREKLDISWNEYIYLDMVQKLHISQSWCTKSLQHCADDLGLSKRGLIKMRDNLIDKGLLKKNIKGHLRVTSKYIEVAVNKVHHTSKRSVNKVPESVNKVQRTGEQSATKNNNRIKENKERDFGGIKKYQEMRARLGL
jgi:predicted transcriptional regulator